MTVLSKSANTQPGINLFFLRVNVQSTNKDCFCCPCCNISHYILTVNEMWGSLLLSVSDTSWGSKIQQGSEKLTTA